MDDDATDQEATPRRNEARARLAVLDSREARYRLLFETIDDGFSVVECLMDESGQVVDWIWLEVNEAFEHLSTLKDVVGRRASELLPSFADNAKSLGRAIATGTTIRSEGDYSPGIDRWFRAHFSRVGGPDSRVVAVRFEDITERRRVEEALRQSEERQAFLLKLSDTLRLLSDPEAIRAAAVDLLGEHLGVNRAAYVDLLNPQRDDTMTVTHIYNQGVRPWTGDMSVADYGAVLGPAFTSGQTAVVRDVETDPRFADATATYREAEIRAAVAVPIVKGGHYVAVLGVHNAEPRDWSALEIALLEDVANRTWEAVERARAEAALQASEERFVQFANASASGIWIRDAGTLAMEYVSPAIATIYGVEIGQFLGDLERWAAMIVPEDRADALGHIESARKGESVVHEFRIRRPSDGSFRWIRDTDFPLDVNGHVQRIGGIAEDVTDQKLLAEHQGVLLAELQHRVRNIMAIIRSIVARTAEGAGTVADYAELLSGRLLALARVQALLTRAANARVGMASIVHEELNALAGHAGQFDVTGPDVLLSPKAAETMTLAVHELTTNALKYGALASRDGKVTVRWEIIERRGAPWLMFEWAETGAPARAVSSGARRVGFGSELIEGRIPYELGGRGKVAIEPGGARCHLEFPLRDGASVLETDAPQRAKVFGGAIDMSGEADLTGHRVLVLEDDYYLATDTDRALRGAGAEVIGPCPTEEAAREEIAQTPPTCAVLDINLGLGRSFDLARELKRTGVPLIFITGYDQEIIPGDLSEEERLQKPVQFAEVIRALARKLEIDS